MDERLTLISAIEEMEELEEQDRVAIIQPRIKRADIPAINFLLLWGDLDECSSSKRRREGSGAANGSLSSLSEGLSLIFMTQYLN
jgi:hypothetical protein